MAQTRLYSARGLASLFLRAYQLKPMTAPLLNEKIKALARRWAKKYQRPYGIFINPERLFESELISERVKRDYVWRSDNADELLKAELGLKR